MKAKRVTIAIIAAAAVLAAAAAAALVLSTSNNENSSQSSEGWQFETVNDIEKKEATSSDTSSTGSMANVLLSADDGIVSVDRSLEIAEVEIKTPGYGLNSGKT